MKLSIGHECGKEKIAALFGPGSFFPLGIDQHYYDMEYAMVEQAYTEVEAYEFDYRIVRTMFLEHQDLALRMMEHYCDFTSYLFFEIASLSGDNSMAKVCNVLYALHNTSLCRSHVLHISQDDVMELSGISKIQVARVYQTLRGEHIIQTSRGRIQILDQDKLRSYCTYEL